MKSTPKKNQKYFLRSSVRILQFARNLRQRMTDAEIRLWARLRKKQLGVRFRRQVPFQSYVLDFLSFECGLVVEVDGSQHYTPEGREKDQTRDEDLRKRGLRVVHFSAVDVLKNTDGVLMEIQSYIGSPKKGRDPLWSP